VDQQQPSTTTGAFDWVAELYDAYVTTTADIPFFLDAARVAGGPVLELMAGTGRVSLPLARAGVNLTCVDISGPMLDRLRAKLAAEGLRAEVAEADVAKLDLPRRDYALVLLPFQAFGELVSLAAQREALERIAAHMAPGARLICTLHNPAVRRRTVDGQIRLLGSYPVPERSLTLLLWSIQTEDPGEPVVGATQLYELYDPSGLLVEKRKLDVRFRLVERDAFEALAAAAGFTVEALAGTYDSAPFDPRTSPFMISTLRR